ncbi:SMI1/KNR4 family protein [Persicirhabdus sediminis]|uniref:SMI1/KNR4 family protein n=1 Tax=Persicirhabdus sediminis TaxID=454144 RepID=A0A8J7MF48_9BACT|nr:SMI1/KNR4 family protein [Persicirhabdus sediminis]MBK1792182.1 SMI1/KNR4 family protein [Persicirhabdus sediminis]
MTTITPIDLKFIEEAEFDLGIKFPVAYRRKMMRHNGGSVLLKSECYQLHPFLDSSDECSTQNTSQSVVRQTQLERLAQKLPDDIIVIGRSDEGHLLVLLMMGTGNVDERVFWFDINSRELGVAANEFSELNLIG